MGQIFVVCLITIGSVVAVFGTIDMIIQLFFTKKQK